MAGRGSVASVGRVGWVGLAVVPLIAALLVAAPRDVAAAVTEPAPIVVRGEPVGGEPSPVGVGRREVVEARTRTSSTFELSSGSFETVVSAGSEHFETPSGWAPIDNRLVASGEGWRNSANAYELELPASADGAVVFRAGGVSVSARLEGAASARGVASGD